jgi:DNA primase
MAGRIRDEDIAAIRERVSIDTVIGDYVALRGAGAGALKGLCPFHEEKTPSFTVRPQVGMYKCFGCGASGDVITFVRTMEQVEFVDAIELLARRAGIALTFEQGGSAGHQGGKRARLLEAHGAAAQFFAEQLTAAGEASVAREFLLERGFDETTWLRFGVGYAPASYDALTKHLRARGFTVEELTLGGLASTGQHGPIDRFRGRLLWPIRDVKGDTIGFGARRLRDDDRIDAKYINTAETPLYRKSQVLYGVDLAKKQIAGRHRAVVVEGYTDVMACHLAGEDTAVATCGTAFGVEHVAVLRRLLMDQDEFLGRVIFTFDGDEAGRKAALKAFNDDQRFVAQTFVAVQPDGLDPCELRQQRGDIAVRDLVASHIPLAEFAIRSTLERYDLELPEGRVQALTATAPVVAGLKDASLRGEYARRLAGWLGMEVEAVIERVRAASGPAQPEAPAQRAAPRPAIATKPDPREPKLVVERELVKVAVQRPALVGAQFDELADDCFTAPAYREVREAVVKAGGAGSVGSAESSVAPWVAAVQEAATTDAVRDLVAELAVESLMVAEGDEDDGRYARALLVRVAEMAITRHIAEVKSRLQRLDPIEHALEYNRMFGDLIALEQHRKTLREETISAL